MPSAKAKVVQHQPQTLVEIRLRLPVALIDLYEEQAIAAGRLLEDELLTRLHRCQTHTASKPLYFNDAQRGKLERALGHLVQHPDVALTQLEGLIKLKVGDVEVDVSAQLLQRLATRTFRGETLPDVIKRETVRGLRKFCALE